MRPDSLATVIQLRRLTVDNARMVLVDILRQQDEAEREVIAAEHAIREESARASDPGSGDAVVDAFAAWLPEGRRRARAAQAALDQAATQTAQARTVLAMARTALKAVESLAEAQRAGAERDMLRREQHELDEAARRAMT